MRILATLLLIATVSAKDFDLCGTTAGRTQQELFLHRRSLLGRVRADSLRSAAPSYAQDFGNIAVMDDSNGVIGRRNAFDLDRRTVSFVPSASGYRVELGGDTFDLTASQSGKRVEPLTDDDTQRVALPFSFRFYGRDHREIWINSNGTLTFSRGDTDYTGSYGHFVAGPPSIAGLFTDLDPPSSQAGVRVVSDAARFVVTWSSIPLAGSAGFGSPQLQNVQIRIFPTGRIEIAYRSANPPNALAGITPGNTANVDLVALSSSPSSEFSSGVAEVFSSLDSVDIVAASQRFYQTHQDSYDYLVFYNAASVRAGPGSVAYEVTTRSQAEGIGDVLVNDGVEYGSKSRLKAVMNMGPIAQYPLNPHGIVSSRAPVGDTPVTLLGHEAGHLFLALVSVGSPSSPSSTPMLTTDRAHWAFPFNSEASVMGGERIEDRGTDTIPRFTTTATVEGYGPLDQYLMGLRSVSEVPPTFVVLDSGYASRISQVGVSFGGNRLDVTAAAIEARYGRRTPDATVTQRHYSFGFALIVPTGTDAATVDAAVQQVDQYRMEFEKFFGRATSDRAGADTALRKSAKLSLAPSAGLVEFVESSATLELEQPATEAVRFTIRKPNNVVAAPAFVAVPAGASKVTFPVYPARTGVEDLTLEPSSPKYETVAARVQVRSAGDQRLGVSGKSIVVEDVNHLPYGGVRVRIETVGGVQTVVSTQDGKVAVSGDALLAFPGVAEPPRIDFGGVVDAFTYTATLTSSGYVSIFGRGLEDAMLKLDGIPVPALYTSARQVNFQAPANLSSVPVRLTVETPRGVALATVTFQPVP